MQGKRCDDQEGSDQIIGGVTIIYNAINVIKFNILKVRKTPDTVKGIKR